MNRFSRIFDFVIGFSASKMSTAVMLPFVRPALVEILTTKTEPWDAIIAYCAGHEEALGHTPIVVLDIDEGKVRGRQLVLSMPVSHPWGFIPRCGGLDECIAMPGDVRGMIPRSSRKAKDHMLVRLRCERCFYFCWIARPGWIKQVRKEPLCCYETPWPMSEDQVKQAMGLDQEWKLFEKSPGENGASEVATQGGRKRGRSVGEWGVSKRSRENLN